MIKVVGAAGSAATLFKSVFTAPVIIVSCVAAVILYAAVVVGCWRIFEKAGQQGWKAIIPIYNIYILYKISWNIKYFFVLLGIALFIGIVGNLRVGNPAATIIAVFIVILLIASGVIRFILLYRLSRAFGHGWGYTIGLFLLPYVFLIILGLGLDKYKGMPFGASNADFDVERFEI